MKIPKSINIILMITLLYVACEKDNPNPTNNNECSNCFYNDLCLDPTKFETTGLNELFGTWRFKGFINDECSLETAPNVGLDSILLSFEENNIIKGYILPNVFDGKYEINESQIMLSEIISTEINEPDWSKRFNQAFNSLQNFTVDKKSLYFTTNEGILLFDQSDDIQNSICLSCKYEAICLDTTAYENISKAQLIGEWALTKYINLPNCSIDEKPTYLTETVKIIFFDNDSISGSTPSNDFTAQFVINENKLTLENIFTTEVNEPEWGIKFWESIYNINQAIIEDETLVIHTPNRILIFIKN